MIYEFKHYKEIIERKINEFSHIKGYRAKLAEVAKCQRSVISQVINTESTHLSFEQAAYLAKFWEFSSKETQYFLALLGKARAGSLELESFYNNQIEDIKKANEDLANRFEESSLDDLSRQTLYYSQWQNAAVHVLLNIHHFSTPRKIADRLQIGLSEVERIFQTLESLDLIEKEDDDSWKQKVGFLHIPKDSPLTTVNHMNWRHKAMTKVQKKEESDLFFTAALSCSPEGFEKIKKAILKAIDSTRDIVKSCEPEELYGLNFDLYKV